MKKTLITIILSTLTIVGFASAKMITGYDTNNNYTPVRVEAGKYVPGISLTKEQVLGDTITPISPFVFTTPTPSIKPTISASSLKIPSLASAGLCVVTDATGLLSVASCGTGGGGGSGNVGTSTANYFTYYLSPNAVTGTPWILKGTNGLTITSSTINSLSNYIDADAVHFKVLNASGGIITTGTPVYATQWNAGVGATEVDLADADNAIRQPAIGLAEQTLADGAVGEVRAIGTLDSGVNTNVWSDGTDLYLSTTPGQLTATRPAGINTCVQKIGRVVRQSATDGRINVIGAGRCNDVPNNFTVVNATTTNFSASNICISGDCKSAWPSGSSGGFGVGTSTAGYFTLYDTNTSVTGTPLLQATTDTISFGSDTESMRITPEGKIGIGTDSPSSTLHIIGDVISTGTSTAPCFSTDGVTCLGGTGIETDPIFSVWVTSSPSMIFTNLTSTLFESNNILTSVIQNNNRNVSPYDTITSSQIVFNDSNLQILGANDETGLNNFGNVTIKGGRQNWSYGGNVTIEGGMPINYGGGSVAIIGNSINPGYASGQVYLKNGSGGKINLVPSYDTTDFGTSAQPAIGIVFDLETIPLTNSNNLTFQDKSGTIALTTDNVSQFTNDAGYLGSGANISSLTNDANYVSTGANLSVFVNDSGFITGLDFPTGLTSTPLEGQMLIGNATGGWDLIASSTLGSGGSTYVQPSTSTWASVTTTNLYVSGATNLLTSANAGLTYLTIANSTSIPTYLTVANSTSIPTYLKLSGGTMTGGFTMLNATSTSLTTTNLYVSGATNLITSANVASTYLTIANSTSIPTYLTIANSTTIPTYLTVANSTTIPTYLKLAGGTMTGGLTMTTATATSITSTNLYVSGAVSLPASSITDTMLASSFLKLSGGTMTGGLTMLNATSTSLTSTNLYVSGVANIVSTSIGTANITTLNLINTIPNTKISGLGTLSTQNTPSAGIVTSNGSSLSNITDNSTNWNTAFTNYLQWDGGSTNLVAATGRTSLGLGDSATLASSTWLKVLPTTSTWTSVTSTNLAITGIGTCNSSNQALQVNATGGVSCGTLATGGGSFTTTTINGLTTTAYTFVGSGVTITTSSPGTITFTVTPGGGAGGGVNTSTAGYMAYYMASTAVTGTPALTYDSVNGIVTTVTTTLGTGTTGLYTDASANVIIPTILQINTTTMNTATHGLLNIQGDGSRNPIDIRGSNGASWFSIGAGGGFSALQGGSFLKDVLYINGTTTYYSSAPLIVNSSIGINTSTKEDLFMVQGDGTRDLADFYDSTGNSVLKIQNNGFVRLETDGGLYYGAGAISSSTSPGLLSVFDANMMNGRVFAQNSALINQTSSIRTELLDPSTMSSLGATGYHQFYSDDVTRMISTGVTAGLFLQLRSMNFGAVSQLYFGLINQRVTTTDFIGLNGLARGAITYQGYHYVLMASTTAVALTNVARTTSSPNIDFSLRTNWTTSTWSGARPTTGAAYPFIAGAANGRIYVVSSTTQVIPLLINTSTNSITVEATITVSGANMLINNTRVNDNGIYAGFNAAPFVRKHTLAGVAVGGIMNFYNAVPVATIGEIFATRNSFYANAHGAITPANGTTIIMAKMQGY